MLFPQAWVWMQTNHFEQPRISLTASVAIIPWMGQRILQDLLLAYGRMAACIGLPRTPIAVFWNLQLTTSMCAG